MNADHLKQFAIQVSQDESLRDDAARTLSIVAHTAIFLAEKAGAKKGTVPGAEVPEWLVWSREHQAWWKAGGSGYAKDLILAGIFTETQAREICCRAADGWRDGKPPEETMIKVDDLLGRFDAPTEWLIYEMDAAAFYGPNGAGYVDMPSENAGFFSYYDAMTICQTVNRPGKPLAVAMVPAATMYKGAAPKPGEAIPGLGMSTDQIRLARIAAIIEAVDDRCAAADGPVTSTLKEMTQDEISRIYALAKGHNEDWRP